MKLLLIFLILCTVPAIARAHDGSPNVLLICIDDLRPELRSFGVDYIESPNIDRLASTARAFHRHYVQAPTCGASRYALLTGRYGAASNKALFQRAQRMAKSPRAVTPSMPEWFRRHGYRTVSVGKVSHHPGGWGGEDWNDLTKIEMPGAWDLQLMPCGLWEHPRGAMHGLANGEKRTGKSYTKHKMEALQSAIGPDTIYNDGLIADEAASQLTTLAELDQPFFLAVGLIKPHLPFGAPRAYMAPYENVELPPIPHPTKPVGRTTWHKSGEFFAQYNHYGKDPREDQDYADQVRRHYAACVTYADKHVGDLLATLKSLGRDKDTIVVLWGDHGWHLGEHAIWGKHSLFEESLRSPLIIRTPEMSDPGKQSQSIVETIDIFPTLCELTNVPAPEFAQGVSLTPQMADPNAVGHSAVSYTGKVKTIRTDSHRMSVHADGVIELYDHRSIEKETKNVAQQNPDLCQQLQQLILEKIRHPHGN